MQDNIYNNIKKLHIIKKHFCNETYHIIVQYNNLQSAIYLEISKWLSS